jgi:serine/threonine protein phosphatase 1
MKILVIGDIHGCYVEMQRLLEKADLTSEDKVIALGDFVDRGPESPEVLNFFRTQPGASSLMGNHERKHIRSFRGELQPAISQRITHQQLGDDYPEAVAWMESLPLYLELPGTILVHGYLEPGIPLEAQRERVLCGTMGGDHYLRSTYDRPWYELWDDEKPVIVGHLDYLRTGDPFIYQDRIFGLDTGCAHGRLLTGLLLPDFRLISVPSRGDHWSALRNQYRIERSLRAAEALVNIDFTEPWDEECEWGLDLIMTFVQAESEQLLAELEYTPGFHQLTPRQQAKAYAEVVSEYPAEALFHMARLGKLSKERARRILRDATQIEGVMQQLGL